MLHRTSLAPPLPPVPLPWPSIPARPISRPCLPLPALFLSLSLALPPPSPGSLVRSETVPYTDACLTSIRLDDAPRRARYLQLHLQTPAPDTATYALRNISVIGVPYDEATAREANECEKSLSAELVRRLALALEATPLDRVASHPAAPDEEPTPAPHIERLSIESSVGATLDEPDSLSVDMDERADSVVRHSHSDARSDSQSAGQLPADDSTWPPAAVPMADTQTKHSVELQLPALQKAVAVETAAVAPCTTSFAAAGTPTNGNGNGDIISATAVGQGGGGVDGLAAIDYIIKRNRENRRSPRGSPRSSPRRPERAHG